MPSRAEGRALRTMQALLFCRDRGNLVCENNRARPYYAHGPFYVQCAASHTGRKLIKQLIKLQLAISLRQQAAK